MQPSIMLCSSSLARCTYVHILASAAVHAVNCDKLLVMLGSLMDMLLCWLCWLWTCLFPEASPLYMVNLLRAYIHQHDPQLHPELSKLGWGPNTSDLLVKQTWCSLLHILQCMLHKR